MTVDTTMNEAYFILKYGSVSEAVEAWIYNEGEMPVAEADYIQNYLCTRALHYLPDRQK